VLAGLPPISGSDVERLPAYSGATVPASHRVPWNAKRSLLLNREGRLLLVQHRARERHAKHRRGAFVWRNRSETAVAQAFVRHDAGSQRLTMTRSGSRLLIDNSRVMCRVGLEVEQDDQEDGDDRNDTEYDVAAALLADDVLACCRSGLPKRPLFQSAMPSRTPRPSNASAAAPRIVCR